MKIVASALSLTNRRKLRPSLWPVSRNAIIACAGLCGFALTPHSAFSATTIQGTPGPVVAPIDSESETLVAMVSGRYRLTEDLTSAPLNGSLCVDVQQMFGALDFPIIVDRSQQTATGWFINETKTFSLDLKTGAAQVGAKKSNIPTESIGMLSTGSCVTIDALAPLLGLSIEYEARGSFISVTSAQPLSLMERLSRQDRTQRANGGAAVSGEVPHLKSLPYRAFVAPNVDVSLNFNRSPSADTRSVVSSNWGVLAVGELAFMTAEAQLSGSGAGLQGDLSRFRLYRSETRGGVFGVSKLTEFSVGDIAAYGSTLGSNGGTGFGFSASSFPLDRPTSFDRTSFEGPLPVGWDVELYRNGQLLEFRNDGSTGGYSFRDVPVLFGDNNFEIVQYGPQGQRRVINKRVNASNFLAPKGDSYYRVAIYRPEVLFGTVRSGSGVRIDLRAAIGLGNNFNVGGGFDSYMLQDRRLSVGTISALTSVSGVAINAEVSGTSEGKFAGQIEFQGQGKGASVRGRLILAQNGFESERLARGIVARLDGSADRAFRLSARTGGTLAGRVTLDRFSSNETLFTARERLALSFGNAMLAQSLVWTHSSSGQRRDQIEGDIAYSFRQGFNSIRASAEYSVHPDPQINRLRLSVERFPGVDRANWRWRADTAWNVNDRTFSHTVGVGREFGLLNLELVGETDGRKNHSVGVSLSFALGRRNNGWGMTSRSLAGAGTVRAHIFEDMDDNGTFSAGDVPVAGAGIIGTNSRAASVSNKSGYAVLDSVAPNTATLVTVLSDDLDNPNLYGRPTYTKAREGTVSQLSIALTQMGSVEGTVEMIAGFDPTANPLGGVTLVLLNEARAEVARTTSAYDGYYSFDLVPVGTYTIELAPDTSLAQRMRPVVPVQLVTTRATPGAQIGSMTLIETNPTSTRLPLRGLI